jgi:hypothetical protein
MKTAVDLGLAVSKRNRSALADVTNSKIATRASARAAQGKVQSDAPFLELRPLISSWSSGQVILTMFSVGATGPALEAVG